MLKVPSMALCTCSTLTTAPEKLYLNPIKRKITSVSKNEGTVVKTIYLMWVNKSVPAIAGARLVVSLSGLILSPK